jgi:hypothetical protein
MYVVLQGADCAAFTHHEIPVHSCTAHSSLHVRPCTHQITVQICYTSSSEVCNAVVLL